MHTNQLSGTIPNSLSDLTNLTLLLLSGNNLDGPIPDLSRLTSLTTLYLNENQLSGTIPNLSALTSLQRLSLNHNQLSGGIPATLNTRTGLTHLYLNQNQLSGTIPTLSSLVNLTTLNLANNQLSGTIPAWLEQLTLLQFLDLSGNQLSGKFPLELNTLTNLKLTRFASNTDADDNPSLTGCVPIGLRYLMAAEDYQDPQTDPIRRLQDTPAQDFIGKDTNRDGDTDDPDDIPGLGLPFCMLSTLTFSGVTLEPAFAAGTAAYTADVANTVASTTVTATLAADSTGRLSIKKGTATYTSDAAVPLAVGQNEITITVTPRDGTPTLTYTVMVFRAGVDRDTLMALYNSAGGTGWTTDTNWGETGVAIGMWEGVITNSSGSVTALDLPGNNLSGTLPAALGSLTSLITLDLSNNRLSRTIPNLSRLTSLRTLNLGGNQVSGTIPDWLSSLTSLRTLNLRDNRLTGSLPEDWDALNQLDVLYLDDNQLRGDDSGSARRPQRIAGHTLRRQHLDGMRARRLAQTRAGPGQEQPPGPRLHRSGWRPRPGAAVLHAPVANTR